MAESIFDNIIQLPNAEINEKSNALIGFDQKFNRIYGVLRLLIDKEGLLEWEKKYYPDGLNLISQLDSRYPLVIFEGDVGTGKTAIAEGFTDRMVRSLDKEGFLLKLSTRVRGEGLHGEMGNLVNDAFERVKKEAGKKRLSFLLIDEADAVATSRGTFQMHQEEKAGVNTLIQKIDEIRELKGRAIIILSTNRLNLLDEAIIRRAAIVLKFERPNTEERIELFRQDFNALNFSHSQLDELAKLTGPKNGEAGFSFSDLRLRLFPEVVAIAYPDKPLSYDILLETIKHIQPSPEIK